MQDGEPLSWRHFIYGSAHLSRAHARDSLRVNAAVGMTQAKREHAEPWFARMKSAAGW